MAKANIAKLSAKAAFGAVVGVAALSTVMGSFVMLDETERGIDYRLGEMTSTQDEALRGPGLSFKTPFIDTVKKIDVSLQEIKLNNVVTYTADSQAITSNFVVLFKLPEDKLVSIYKNNPNFGSKLESTVLNAAKDTLGKKQAASVPQNRGSIMNEVTENVKAQVEKQLGLEILDVQMPNFDFDDDYEQKVREAANANAELAKAITDNKKVIENAQAAKTQSNLEADAEAYKIEAESTANAAANLALKQSEAQGILAVKNAEAEGFQNIANSIGKENMGTYMTTSTWDGAVSVVSGSNASTFVNMDDLTSAAAAKKVQQKPKTKAPVAGQ